MRIKRQKHGAAGLYYFSVSMQAQAVPTYKLIFLSCLPYRRERLRQALRFSQSLTPASLYLRDKGEVALGSICKLN